MKLFWLLTIVLAGALVAVSVKYAETMKESDKRIERDGVSSATSQVSADVLECIMTRASVRQYKKDAVPDSLLEKVLRAGMAAPTAMNKQPWVFIVVNDRQLLDGIHAKMPNVHCQDAPLAIVVCGDMDKAIEGEGRDYWIQDTSAATENMLLAAHALGLGTVWCGLTPMSERVAWMKEYLAMPANLEPLGLVCLGWPANPTPPKDKWNAEAVYYNRF